MEKNKFSDFGEFFRHKRLSKGLSLRKFCREYGFDPGNISRMERGKSKPPRGKALEKYAPALSIEIGSEEWIEFETLASVSQ